MSDVASNRVATMRPSADENMLAEHILAQKQRIAELEELALQAPRPQSTPDNQIAQFESELESTWTTGTRVPQEDDDIFEYELVLLPFMCQLQHLWSMDTQHNASNGTKDRWSQIDASVKWYDPLVPSEEDIIKSLKRWGLIQRVAINSRETHPRPDPMERFTEKFQYVLESVTNVKFGETLKTAYERIGRDIGIEADTNAAPAWANGFKAPAWANGFKAPIVPLKPGFMNDKVLEYLPMSSIRNSITWNIDFFNRPTMCQLVRDPSTGAEVRRVFFTTVEGYLGLMSHGLGLDTMGMSE